ATLERSLSPADLVAFQGCIIPPLTPQREPCPEDQDQFCPLVFPQLHLTVSRRQEEINALQQRNVHLRELAIRAQHLASVLDKLMMRQRLDDTCDDTSPPGCVEDILRDVSERCNTVLHHNTAQPPLPQDSDPERILMFGAFSGLQTSRITGGAVVSMEDTEAGESSSDSSFRTSIREHCTIRTQTFPHGHAFTSRTTQGGYRFRWVPSQS
uniref:Multiciliate differentiation and DNA synthesis-associated cell cycle protein n=1 Tax=Hucho hucho TaxID=62062 RepID=A0A4W5Q1L6_9TELE